MSLEAKQISELVETGNLDSRDLMIVNVFDPTIGYRLTKKVSISTLALHIVDNYAKSFLRDDFNLKELASMTVEDILYAFMTRYNKSGNLSASLAISTLTDLNLGDLATMNLRELELDRFVEQQNANSSLYANAGEYIRGIVQANGKISLIATGKFSEAVPVDAKLNRQSTNPVQNCAIVEELNKKVNATDVNSTFFPIEGKYIAGLTLENGKITAVLTFTLPKLPIDNRLDTTSVNPVENRVVANALETLETNVTNDANKKFVKLVDANSYLKANAGNFITSVRQIDGKITNIETGNYDALFAALEAKINAMKAAYEAEIAALRREIDSKYVKLSSSATQTITGPVTFNAKITGNITNADYAVRAQWS